MKASRYDKVAKLVAVAVEEMMEKSAAAIRPNPGKRDRDWEETRVKRRGWQADLGCLALLSLPVKSSSLFKFCVCLFSLADFVFNNHDIDAVVRYIKCKNCRHTLSLSINYKQYILKFYPRGF